MTGKFCNKKNRDKEDGEKRADRERDREIEKDRENGPRSQTDPGSSNTCCVPLGEFLNLSVLLFPLCKKALRAPNHRRAVRIQ